MVFFLLGILLISPLIYAQEQVQLQTYSGLGRFVDNVKLFFSSGDNKVMLSLEIREKEVNSVIANIEKSDTEKVNKNLENAFNKLIFVQEKVSFEIADEVEASVEEVVNKIEEADLSEELNRYVLEEKKTQLVAELVVEVEGKEGQTLTREVIQNGTDGRKMVRIEIAEDNGQIRVMEIEGEIAQINNQIAEHTYAGGTGPNIVVEGEDDSDGESNRVVEGNDNGVKTYVAGDGTDNEESLPEPDLNKFNPDLYNPNARASGDIIDETYDDEEVEGESCGDGVLCEGESNIIEDGEETNDIAPAVESNEGAPTIDEGTTGLND